MSKDNFILKLNTLTNIQKKLEDTGTFVERERDHGNSWC